MRGRRIAGVAVVGLGVVWLSSGALAFQCPALIQQATQAIGQAKLDEGKLQQAKDLVAAAQRLHDAGDHAGSVQKAQEALGLLGVSAAPARRGSSY